MNVSALIVILPHSDLPPSGASYPLLFLTMIALSKTMQITPAPISSRMLTEILEADESEAAGVPLTAVDTTRSDGLGETGAEGPGDCRAGVSAGAGVGSAYRLIFSRKSCFPVSGPTKDRYRPYRHGLYVLICEAFVIGFSSVPLIHFVNQVHC